MAMLVAYQGMDRDLLLEFHTLFIESATGRWRIRNGMKDVQLWQIFTDKNHQNYAKIQEVL